MKTAAGALDDALLHAVEVKGIRVVTLRADSLERGQLRTLVDNLKQKIGEGIVVLASAQPEGKVAIIAGVTSGLIKRIQAQAGLLDQSPSLSAVQAEASRKSPKLVGKIRDKLTVRSWPLLELLRSC